MTGINGRLPSRSSSTIQAEIWSSYIRLINAVAAFSTEVSPAASSGAFYAPHALRVTTKKLAPHEIQPLPDLQHRSRETTEASHPPLLLSPVPLNRAPEKRGFPRTWQSNGKQSAPAAPVGRCYFKIGRRPQPHSTYHGSMPYCQYLAPNSALIEASIAPRSGRRAHVAVAFQYLRRAPGTEVRSRRSIQATISVT